MKQNPCRYCACSLVYKGKHGPSWASDECRKCENIKKHKEYLLKERKYKRGESITDFQELMNQTFVYCGFAERPMHIEAVKSWQLRIILDVLQRGKFYKAIRKESEEK